MTLCIMHNMYLFCGNDMDTVVQPGLYTWAHFPLAVSCSAVLVRCMELAR